MAGTEGLGQPQTGQLPLQGKAACQLTVRRLFKVFCCGKELVWVRERAGAGVLQHPGGKSLNLPKPVQVGDLLKPALVARAVITNRETLVALQ